MTEPDWPALDGPALRRALGDRFARIDVVEATGSTNADLLDAAQAGAPDRTVLVAEHQVTGRGRLGRTWTAPPRAGLAVSVLLRPVGVPAARFGWVSLLAGLAAYEAVRRLTPAWVGLKWPNDLQLGPQRHKVAGILGQAAGPPAAIVIGIGLNVHVAPPVELPATSLADHGEPPDRTAVLAALLARLDAQEARWRSAAGDADACGLRADYRRACASVGADVRVERPGGDILVGRAEDVDADGRLVVRDGSGAAHAVSAGDVVHLRPAPR